MRRNPDEDKVLYDYIANIFGEPYSPRTPKKYIDLSIPSEVRDQYTTMLLKTLSTAKNVGLSASLDDLEEDLEAMSAFVKAAGKVLDDGSLSFFESNLLIKVISNRVCDIKAGRSDVKSLRRRVVDDLRYEQQCYYNGLIHDTVTNAQKMFKNNYDDNITPEKWNKMQEPWNEQAKTINSKDAHESYKKVWENFGEFVKKHNSKQKLTKSDKVTIWNELNDLTNQCDSACKLLHPLSFFKSTYEDWNAE